MVRSYHTVIPQPAMMKIFIVLSLTMLVGGRLSAQSAHTIHTPAEIVKTMIDSKIQYFLKPDQTGQSFLDTTNYRNILVPSFLVQRKFGDTVRLRQYELNSDAQKILESAETAFQSQKSTEAREKYKQVLDKVPECSTIMDFIGQTYEHDGDFKTAAEWYRKAIEVNPIDYMGHWFLAAAISRTNDSETVDEILTALVLNRNNPRLMDQLYEILRHMGYVYDDWHFVPKYKLEKVGDSVNVIYGGVDWVGYAMAKALWAAEPGFRPKSHPGDSLDMHTTEELEALAMIYQRESNTPADSGKSTDEGIVNMAKALDKKLGGEFVLFELFLRKQPIASALLPHDTIHDLVQYVRQMHVRKIER